MRISILGSGLMGPAAAYNAMSDHDVARVTLCDLSEEQLAAARLKLESLPGAEKLRFQQLHLGDQALASRLMAGSDAVVAALPRTATPFGIRAAAAAGAPLIDLSQPLEPELPALRKTLAGSGSLVILGCGVEPGLTEIMARHLTGKLDRVDELHIKCGGIPEKPTPPLGYKIVFGGRQLPFREGDALVVQDGKLVPVPRYSGVEPVSFPGLGECEAWHEGFMPWLMDLEALRGLKRGTQMTCRWPGYGAKATVLRDLGLFSQEPVEVDGVPVVPKKLLDALLYPLVRLEEGERDLTLFRVEALGSDSGTQRKYRIDMVDRFDDRLGFTSMARTTAFTGAIVARMVARGEIEAKGLTTPEQVVTGPLFEQLVAELAVEGVHFTLDGVPLEQSFD